MKTQKELERPAYIAGISLDDFVTLLLIGGAIFMITMLLNTFGLTELLIPGILTSIFGTWGLFLLFVWGTKSNYPNFLMSFFSYKFMQPRKINVDGFKIEIKQ